MNIIQFSLLLVSFTSAAMLLTVACLLYAAQKYMSFMTSPEEQLKVVKMKGLRHVETSSVDAATYLETKIKQGTSWLRVIYLRIAICVRYAMYVRTPVVSADALISFFPSSYSNLPIKFVLASRLKKV